MHIKLPGFTTLITISLISLLFYLNLLTTQRQPVFQPVLVAASTTSTAASFPTPYSFATLSRNYPDPAGVTVSFPTSDAFFSIFKVPTFPLHSVGSTSSSCQAALVITSTANDEATCGTLRYALAYLAANPTSTPRTVTFNLSPLPARITLSGSSLTIPPNTVLQGQCVGAGAGAGAGVEPQIILDGAGITGDGLILGGNDTLFGLKIGGFAGRTLVAGASSAVGTLPNTLRCVSLHSGGTYALRPLGETTFSTPVGTNFPQPPAAVTLTRWTGEPLAGVGISFQINSDAPGGAAGTFSTSGGTAGPVVVTTDADGRAFAPSVVANTHAGSFTLRATPSGVSSSQFVLFNLTNRPGPPANLAITLGSNQTTVVGTPFPSPLKVAVSDAYGNPTAGVGVRFTSPASGSGSGVPGAFFGPDGTFASVVVVNTDASGEAVVNKLWANGVVGSFNLVVSLAESGAGTASPVNFVLTNRAGPPASVTVVAGNNQRANVGAAFGTQLALSVKDAYGNPLSGQRVNFSVPSTGASGTWATTDATTLSVTTDGNGLALAPVLRANSQAGSYTVEATVVNANGSPVASTVFNLTNFYGQTSFEARVSDPNPAQNSTETVYARLNR